MAEEAKKKESGFKPAYAIAMAIAAIAIIGLVYMATNSGAASGPVVTIGDNISVYYTGTYTNGTVFDSNAGKAPLNFTVGSGQLIKGFDDAVVGMKLNETKTVTIPANEAYGEANQSLIVAVPRSDFNNQTVTIGMIVSTSRGAQGRVTAVNATNVTVDFNSPLAGQTLVFKITVVSIKK